MIGLGMGPLCAGLLSDWLSGMYGVDGLRYAMLIISLIGLLGIYFFFQAGRHLQADLADRAAEDAKTNGSA